MAHLWNSLPLSRDAVRTLERCGHLTLGFGSRKIFPGLLACVLLDMLLGMRERS